MRLLSVVDEKRSQKQASVLQQKSHARASQKHELRCVELEASRSCARSTMTDEHWWEQDRSWLEREAFAELVSVVRDSYPIVVLVAAITQHLSEQEAKKRDADAESARERRRASPAASENIELCRSALKRSDSAERPF